MKKRCVFSLLIVAMFSMTAPAVAADTVAVAGSIFSCVTEMTQVFEESGKGEAPELVMSSSGKLAAQVQAGAPFGLYLSASPKWTKLLEEEGLIEDVAPMAVCPVVAWWPKEEAPDLALIGDGVTSVAIADPESAPFGKAAAAYLKEQGVYDKLMKEDLLVITGPVQQAGLAADQGGVDIGMVSLSVAVKMDKGGYTVVPIAPLKNSGGMVKAHATENLRQFWLFLRTPEVAGIWEKWGFEPLNK
ncbi:MAG: molybdate ABC transporter substrate-binding protein [Synergistota bacterium]|nr:molybdate ABC transporter substrate-binding protein [Synergistota bacterium]